MYQVKLEINVQCDVHPNFSPVSDILPKGCPCCQAISYIHQWRQMIESRINAIDIGLYQGKKSSDDRPKETLEQIADVAVASTAPTGA